jgi:predicted restriction endonuclease
VLCPNHHVMFDRGAITIDIENNIVIHKNEDNELHNKQVLMKHMIDKQYIDYHNVQIFRK